MSSEKKCCKRMGSILSFLAICVWVGYYYEIRMMEEVGSSSANVSFRNHLLVFLVLFIPGIYLTKFKKNSDIEKKSD